MVCIKSHLDVNTNVEISCLRLLLVLATDHNLLRMFLNISGQILFPGDLHDAAL